MCDTSDQSGTIEKIQEEVRSELSDGLKSADNLIITLSSGFLAVSVAFIKDGSPIHNLLMLHYSWISFGFAILSVLCSHHTSYYGNKKLDAWIKSAVRIKRNLGGSASLNDAPPIPRSFTVLQFSTETLNIMSSIGFVLGVTFMLCFIIRNTA